MQSFRLLLPALVLSVLAGCQTYTPSSSMTLPSGRYLEHPPQYFPPTPAFPLPRELAMAQAPTAPQAPAGVPTVSPPTVLQPGTPLPLPAPPGPLPAPVAPPATGGPVTTRPKELVPALVQGLKDSEADVRRINAATLTALGTDAVPALAETLQDKDRDLRANAAYLLGQLGRSATGALPALLGALKDQDGEVRRRAAFAVHRIVTEGEGAVREGRTAATGTFTLAPARWTAAPTSDRVAALDPGLLLPSLPQPVPAPLPAVPSY